MNICLYFRCSSFLFLLFLLLLNGIVSAQSYSITGTVLNEDAQPLPGASVAIHEVQKGTITDEEGKFTFDRIKPGTYHLHVSFIGYESTAKTVSVKSKNAQVVFELHETPLEIKEIIVEADHVSSEEEHSMTIEVADEKFLEKNRSSNLAKTLEKMPGIELINIGPGLAKPVLRGMSFNRVTTTTNGIKQEDQQWGSDHGLMINPFNVGKVEIIKGPASVLYGSDAIGGVLNIKSPPPPKEGTFSAGTDMTGESNSSLYGGSGYAEGNHKGNFFRAGYSVKEYGDLAVPANSFSYNRYILPIDNGRIKNTAGNENGIFGSAGINRNWGITKVEISNFHQNAGFFPGAFGRPNVNSVADDGNSRNIDNPQQEMNHFKVVSNTRLLFKKNWLEIDAGYQQNIRKEREDIGNSTPDADLSLLLDLQTYTFNTHYHHYVTNKMNLIYGLSGYMKDNSIGGFEFLIPEYRSYNGAAFTYAEYKWKKTVTLNAGARLDHGKMKLESYAGPVPDKDPNIFQQISPEISRKFTNLSGAAGISFFPTHHFNIKFNAGSAFRYPTVPELASNGLHHGTFRYEKGNPDLNPERSLQFDLNFNFHKDRWLLKWTPYFNYFQNFIYISPSGSFVPNSHGGGQLYQYQQAEAIHSGAELVFDYHLHKRLHLGITGAYVFAQNLSSGYPLPFIPAPSIATEVEYKVDKAWKFRDLYIMMGNKVTTTQNRTARNELETPGAAIFNGAIGGSIKVAKKRVNIHFRVENITNSQYYYHLSKYRILNLPEPGRNFILNISLPFVYTNK